MWCDDLAQLWMTEPTVSANVGAALYSEVVWTRTSWRCYTSHTYGAGLTSLMLRFVRSHATQPGVLSHETLAGGPVASVGFLLGPVRIRGAIFCNGACFQFVRDGTETLALFVDEAVCQAWGYPSWGCTNMATTLAEAAATPQAGAMDGVSS